MTFGTESALSTLRGLVILAAFAGPALATLPSLPFEPNLGQADASVSFLAHTPGYSILLGESGTANHVLLPSSGTAPPETVRMVLMGARPHREGVAEALLPSVTNYYGGHGYFRESVPNYAHIRFPSVYAGIDLTWKSAAGQVEYEFRVAPRAEPSRIRFRFEGARNQWVDGRGRLVITCRYGTIRYDHPVAYQEADGRRRYIRAAYRMKGEIIIFAFGPYDHNLPLVIDPTLDFSSYLGGGGFDTAHAVAADSSGIYVVGETASGDFPGISAARRPTRDAFVTKLAADGATVRYTTILASAGNDAARALCLLPTGVLVAGTAGGAGFPVTAGALRTFSAGQEDAFAARLDTSGHLVYSTYIGGSGSDTATGIAADAEGNAYIAGYTSSVDFPTTAGSPQRTLAGGVDAFLVKVNPIGGSLVYSTLLGGRGYDLAFSIAMDPSGNACLAGTTGSADLRAGLSVIGKLAGTTDALVACLDASGSAWKYVAYLGGLGAEEAYALAVDMQGNAYVTGSTISADFFVRPVDLPAKLPGDYDAFLTKLKPDGTLLYATLLGGSGTEAGTAVALDPAGRVWAAGYTGSVDFPVKYAVQPAFSGSLDAFVASFSTDGTLLSAGYLGGSGEDRAAGLALDSTGLLYVVGMTASPNFTGTLAAAPTAYNAFVARIRPAKVTVSIAPVSVTLDAGATQSFSAIVAGTDNTNVIWSLQPAIGTISAAGLYVAPATLAEETPVTVTATSVADPQQHTSAVAIVKPSTQPPASVSVTPSSGSGASQTFAFIFGDPNGFRDIAWAQIILNGNLIGTNACYLLYFAANNGLYLVDDRVSTLFGPLQPGTYGSLENSQCAVDAAGSSSSGSGFQLTLKVAIRFKSVFGGQKNVFLSAVDKANLQSPWRWHGSWNPPGNQPPATVSASPVPGSGLTQVFRFTYADPDGFQDLVWLDAVIGANLQLANVCYIGYDVFRNAFGLVDDAGTGLVGYVQPGASGSLRNSQCTLDADTSSVSTAGNQITIAPAITFKPSFAGQTNVFLSAYDRAGMRAPWWAYGAWIVPSSQAPATVSAYPVPGSGASQIFRFTYADAEGARDLTWVEAIINGSLLAAHGCYIAYNPATNRISLVDDTGSVLLGNLTPGTPGSTENSQCAVNSGAAQVSTAGEQLILTVPVTFKPSFAGQKSVFLSALDGGARRAPWKWYGSWDVTAGN